MNLKVLLKKIGLINNKILYNHTVNSVISNSKLVKENDVFVAIKGEKNDGNNFIREAIKKGAKTIVTEIDIDVCNVNIIKVNDARLTLAIMLKYLYKDISSKMCLVGVTGTNGKTTITTICYKYYLSLREKVTLIGSNGIYIGYEYIRSDNTTPAIEIIYNTLIESYKQGIRKVFMEVSSHAIKMLRVYGLNFKVVLLTNFTQDHLDYHRNILDYKYTKGVFLNKQNENVKVLINSECDEFNFFKRLSHYKSLTYGKNGNYRYYDESVSLMESKFKFAYKNKEYLITSSLLGRYNIENVCAFLAIISSISKITKKTLAFLKRDIIIKGRFEVIRKNNKIVIIDFAHTPDGILKVLTFLNEIKKGKLVTVFGMGGSRDKDKRSIAGDIVSRNSDFAYITTDNPRYEKRLDIINDIVSGFKKNNYEIVIDRGMAITKALKNQNENDIVAILGKGCEEYIIENGEKISFSDKVFVQEIWSGRK